VPKLRRAVIATAVAAAPFALAYRFALVYRQRAGQPRRHLPSMTPADLGLPYESITIPTDGADDLHMCPGARCCYCLICAFAAGG